MTLKPITFSASAGEVRTETVSPAGYEPFTITFAVPGVVRRVGMMADAQNGDTGIAILNYVRNSLQSWSLGDLDRLERVEDPLVLAAIFKVILDAEKDAKNL